MAAISRFYSGILLTAWITAALTSGRINEQFLFVTFLFLSDIPNVMTSCREKGHFFSISYAAVCGRDLVQRDQSIAWLMSERNRGRGQALPALLKVVPSVTPRSRTQTSFPCNAAALSRPNAVAFNTVPHAVVSPTTTLLAFPLHNSNFASVMNHNVNICRATLKRSQPTG